MRLSRKRFVAGNAVLAIGILAIMVFSGNSLGAPVLEGGTAQSAPVASLPPQGLSTASVGHAPTGYGLASQFVIDGAKGIVASPLAPGQSAGPDRRLGSRSDPVAQRAAGTGSRVAGLRCPHDPTERDVPTGGTGMRHDQRQ